jgi:hypothetical protein
LISSGKQALGGGPYKASLRIRNRAYKFDGTALHETSKLATCNEDRGLWLICAGFYQFELAG